MPDNVYDREDFFARYSALPRSVGGLEHAPEWESVRAMLPALAGLDVLDLGCGFGAFARYASAAGARAVLAIDLSEKMLARAAHDTRAKNVRFERAAIEDFTPPPESFDLVYSALALHYVSDLAGVCARVGAALRPGGAFVFTTEHPIFTACAAQSWVVEAGVRVHWPVDDYLQEGARRTSWLAEGVTKYHRTIGTTLDALRGAGLGLRRLIEWGPSATQIAAEPAWADDARRPIFLLVSAARETKHAPQSP